MKPEEYPSETFCKYTNIVTGVLENFERMNTRSGSLKSYLRDRAQISSFTQKRACPFGGEGV